MENVYLLMLFLLGFMGLLIIGCFVADALEGWL